MNKIVKAVSLSMLLSALVLSGCASLEVDKASINESEITLKSKPADIEAEMKTVAEKMGYTEAIERGEISEYPTALEYPKAMVRTFNVTTKEKGQREAIFMRSKISKTKYEIQQNIKRKNGLTTSTKHGSYSTESEAKAELSKLKKTQKYELGDVVTLTVAPADATENYYYTGLKPLTK
jgi:outer membrane murein-binding lipoprotein Lpp